MLRTPISRTGSEVRRRAGTGERPAAAARQPSQAGNHIIHATPAHTVTMQLGPVATTTAVQARQIDPAWSREVSTHRRLFPIIDEVAAATTSAGQHDHREGLQDAVRQAIADRPAARWSLSGRPDFVAAAVPGPQDPQGRLLGHARPRPPQRSRRRLTTSAAVTGET
jgi:hypothetical protein